MSTYKRYISISVNCTLFFTGHLIQALKILFWNPLEWIVRGEIVTPSPLRFFQNYQIIQSDPNRHMSNYKQCIGALFTLPFIHETDVKIFKEFMPHMEKINLPVLELKDKDVMNFKDYIIQSTIPDALTVSDFLRKVAQYYKNNNLNHYITLRSLKVLYKVVNTNISRADREEERQDSFKESCRNYLVPIGFEYTCMPKTLFLLLEAAAASPTCNKIVLSNDVSEIGVVNDWMKDHFYHKYTDEYNHVIFKRKQQI